MPTLDEQVAALTQTVSDLLAAINFSKSYLELAVTSAANSATGMLANSTTSLTIVVGSKSLTIETGKQFTAGQFVVIIDKANVNNWMFGSVTSYNFNTGALVVNVTDTAGSGTKVDWAVSVTSLRGIQGPPGDNVLNAFANKTNTTAGLTYGYYGGNVRVNNSTVNVADGTVALTASTTNYVEVNSAGTVSKNTTGFSVGSMPMAQVVTGTSTITSITDKRGDNTIASIRTVAGKGGDVSLVVADVSGAAPLASPALTGTPTAPTAAVSTNTTQVATTAYVIGQAATASPLMNGTAAVGTATKFAREDHVHASDTIKANLASPTFTGTPAAPTAAVGTSTTQLATTAFVINQAATATPLINGSAAVGTATRYAREDHVHPTDSTRAPLASPALTGTPTAPTAAVDTSTTQIATTAFVLGQVATVAPLMAGTAAVGTSTLYARQDHVHPTDTTRAPLASPALTGNPTATTQTADNNSTRLATTAFVQKAVNGLLSKSVAGGVDVTLTAAEAGNAIIKLTGAITANINVIFPTTTGRWTVHNTTTGAFTVTAKTASGTGIVVYQGGVVDIMGDGTNIVDTSSGNANMALVGTPTAPTATAGTNTTQIATTAYVSTAIANLVDTAPGTLDTLNELAAALGDDPNFATTMTNNLALKAPLASPALTGTPTAPTAAAGDDSTKIATTAYVQANSLPFHGELPGGIDLNTLNYNGIWTQQTNADASSGANYPVATAGMLEVVGSTSMVWQRYTTYPTAQPEFWVRTWYSGSGGIWGAWRKIIYSDSPTFTGVPAAPTAAVSTNTTQLATTAFVIGQAATATPANNGTAAVGTATKFAREDHVHASDTTKANLASPTFTGTPAGPTAAVGTNTTQLATTAFVQAAANGFAAVSIAGSAATVTLTATQYGVATIDLSGARTAIVSVIVPATPQRWVIKDNTTGGFAVTVKTAAGSGVVLQPGRSVLVYSDGTNVYQADYLTDLLTGNVNANNFGFTNVNSVVFADPGPNEGISWTGGNFSIYESPDDLTTNSSGNVQFVSGGVAQAAVQTDGVVRANYGFRAASTSGVTNPAYTFTTDPDTGMYSGGTNILAFATAGSVAATIDSSNNMRIYGGLGVGGSSPTTTDVIRNGRTITGDASHTLINGTLTITDITLTAARTYYGAYQTVVAGVSTLNGFSYDVYATRGVAYVGSANDAAATADVVCGAFGQATNRATGTTTSLVGGWNITQTTRAAAVTTSMYGTYSKSDVDDGTVTNSYGVYNWLELDLGTVTNAYGTFNRLDRDGGTLTRAYGVYNAFEGTIGKRIGVHNVGNPDIDLSVAPGSTLVLGHFDPATDTVTPRLSFTSGGTATFTGDVNVPTQAVGDSSTKVATTEFAMTAAEAAAIVYSIVFG